MADGMSVVAAEDAAGAPLPTPSSEAAEARIANPMTATATPAANPAPTRPFTAPSRAGGRPSNPPRGMVRLASRQDVVLRLRTGGRRALSARCLLRFLRGGVADPHCRGITLRGHDVPNTSVC